MADVFALIEMYGPVLGLLLFIAMKQLQLLGIKPRLDSIDAKLAQLIERTEVVSAEQVDESNDSSGTVPVQEAVQ
jgi:anti-anti-sigma regulatory factor